MRGSKRALGIVAGPRCSGNTTALVGEVLRGAGDAGWETELRCLGALSINPLAACASDEPFGVAGPEDDMRLLYPFLEAMGAFVFGSPIYYDHVSAQAKIFIDRLHHYSKEGTRGLLPRGVAAVVVITYEWDRPGAYSGVAEWLRGRLEHYWGMRVVATLEAEGTVKRPVADRHDLLKRAYEIGRGL